MQKNVGGADKALRVIVGVVIIVLGLYYKSWWGIIGVVPLLTAAFSFCPLYTLLKINTCCCKGGDHDDKNCCCH